MDNSINIDRFIAAQRERVRAASARADARLRELGGNPHRSVPRLEDMTAEEIERDTASIRKIMAIWRQIGKRTPSPIRLPSGRTIVPKSSATGSAQREYAIGRPLRHRKNKGRRV
jgi:hypothetical protein